MSTVYRERIYVEYFQVHNIEFKIQKSYFPIGLETSFKN